MEKCYLSVSLQNVCFGLQRDKELQQKVNQSYYRTTVLLSRLSRHACRASQRDLLSEGAVCGLPSGMPSPSRTLSNTPELADCNKAA